MPYDDEPEDDDFPIEEPGLSAEDIEERDRIETDEYVPWKFRQPEEPEEPDPEAEPPEDQDGDSIIYPPASSQRKKHRRKKH